MISFLSGIIHSKAENCVAIDVSGVGYEVFLSKNTLASLGEIETNLKLEIYTHVTETSLQLFGFKTVQEKAVFLKLISVSGIGPKSALNILSDIGLKDLMQAIATGNIAALTRVSGIGKKTAERLIVELRDKFKDSESLVPQNAANDSPFKDSRLVDVENALISLGYAEFQAKKVVNGLTLNETDTVQILIKKSLANMQP